MSIKSVDLINPAKPGKKWQEGDAAFHQNSSTTC